MTYSLFGLWRTDTCVLFYIWKPLFASTVNYELAEAEGMNPERVNAIFTILLAV